VVDQYTASDLRKIADYGRVRAALLASRPQALLLALALLLFFLSQRDVPSLLFGLFGTIWLLEALFVRPAPWYTTLSTVTSLAPGIAFIGLYVVYRDIRPGLWAGVAIGLGIFSLASGVLQLLQLQRVNDMLRSSFTAHDLRRFASLRGEIWRDPDALEYVAKFLFLSVTYRIKLYPDVAVIVGQRPAYIWAYGPRQISLDFDLGREMALVQKAKLRIGNQSIWVLIPTAHAHRLRAWQDEPRPQAQDTAGQASPSSGVAPSRSFWATVALSVVVATVAVVPFVLHRASLSVAGLPEGERLAVARQWRLLLEDDFARDADRWPEGAYSIRDGSPAWFACARLEALECTFSLDRVSGQIIYPPDVGPTGTFYLAADMTQLAGARNHSLGLMFRRNRSGHYLFTVFPRTQRFQVWLLQNGSYEALTKALPLDAIRDGSSNRLAVLAEGDQFWLYVNDTLATSVRHGLLARGEVGIGVMQLAPGESEIAVDNFELRAP
jgi:hypothetical protein